MTRRAIVDPRRRICFFWSPKCASTSLRRWLFDHYIDSGPTGFNRGRAVRRLLQVQARTAAMMVLEHGFLAVALVRHPAHRIASAYVNKFVRYGPRRLRTLEDLEPQARKAAMEIRARQPGSSSVGAWSGVSLMDLLDLVAQHVSAGDSDQALDAHWNHQVSQELERLGVAFDHICAVESLAEDFAPIQALYENAQAIPTRNVSTYAEPSGVDLSTTPSVELAASEVALEDLLSAPVMKRISDLYECDYLRFGYDPTDPTQPPTARRQNRETFDHPDLDEVARRWAARRKARGPRTFLRRMLRRLSPHSN